jgi:hypothetical protein
MEITDEVGQAKPEPNNATRFIWWLFTGCAQFQFWAIPRFATGNYRSRGSCASTRYGVTEVLTVHVRETVGWLSLCQTPAEFSPTT